MAISFNTMQDEVARIAVALLARLRVQLGGANGCWSVQCSQDVATGSQ